MFWFHKFHFLSGFCLNGGVLKAALNLKIRVTFRITIYSKD